MFTEHKDLVAEKILTVYKSRIVVEEGFRALKSGNAVEGFYANEKLKKSCTYKKPYRFRFINCKMYISGLGLFPEVVEKSA